MEESKFGIDVKRDKIPVQHYVPQGVFARLAQLEQKIMAMEHDQKIQKIEATGRLKTSEPKVTYVEDLEPRNIPSGHINLRANESINAKVKF